jgi:WD40 repeat protein
MLLKHQLQEPAPLEGVRADVPSGVRAVVAKLMAKRPEDRYQTPAEVADALLPFCQGAGPAPVPTAIQVEASAPRSDFDFSAVGDGATADASIRSGSSATADRTAEDLGLGSLPLPSKASRLGKADKKTKRWLMIGVAACLPVAAVIAVVIYLLYPPGQKKPADTGSVAARSPATGQAADPSRGKTHEPTAVVPEPKPDGGEKPAGNSPPQPVSPPADDLPLAAGEVRRFRGDQYAVQALTFSPDGRSALAGSQMALFVWEVGSGRELGRWEGHARHVGGVAFSADGRRALAGSPDNSLLLWDMESGRQLRRCDAGKGEVRCVALSPDGRQALFAARRRGELFLWDLETGNEVRRFQTPPPLSVAFATDGRLALSGHADGRVRLWDVKAGKELRSFGEPGARVLEVAFSRDGRRAFSRSENNTLRVWDVEKGLQNRSLEESRGTVARAAFSPDGRRALVGFGLGFSLYDLGTGKEKGRFEGHRGPVVALAFSPDGRQALSGGSDGVVHLWDLPVGGGPVAEAAPGDKEPAGKKPVPDAAKQAAAEKVIKDLFQEDYARKTTLARLQLATKLLEKAADTKDDPVSTFVLLREARDLATQAGDARTALKAIDELAKDYAVDGRQLKGSVLAKVAEEAKTPVAGKAVVDGYLALVEEAVGADDYEAALGFLSQAEAAARKVNSAPLVSQVQARAQELKAIQRAFSQVQDAAATLRKTPDDPQASLAMGKFLCLLKGDWDKGLPLLAQGSDPAVKALARKEVDAPAGAAEQADVGDGWWDLAEQEQGAVKVQFLRRAYYWYQQAEGGLTGLTQAKVAKRLKALNEQVPDLKAQDMVGELRRFEGHSQEVNGVAFGPDGRRLLSGGLDGTVRLWDVATGKEIRRCEGSAGEVRAVAFSPDNHHAASCGSEGTTIWDVETGQSVHRAYANLLQTAVHFSCDGRHLVSCGARGSVQTITVESKTYGFGLSGPSYGIVASAAFSPDDRLVVFAAEDGGLHFVDLPNRKTVGKPLRSSVPVSCVAFSPVGHYVLGACQDKVLRVWDVSTGQLIRVFRGHSGPVTSAAFSKNGRYLLSGSADKTVRLWEAKSGRELRRFEGHTGEVTSVALSPDGRRAASASADKTVRLWGLPR